MGTHIGPPKGMQPSLGLALDSGSDTLQNQDFGMPEVAIKS